MSRKGATRSWKDRLTVRDKSQDGERLTTNTSFKRKYASYINQGADGKWRVTVPDKLKPKDYLYVIADQMLDINHLCLQDDNKMVKWKAFERKYNKLITELNELRETLHKKDKDIQDYEDFIVKADALFEELEVDFDEYRESVNETNEEGG